MKQKVENALTHCKRLARKARLRYVNDNVAGFTRRRSGNGFRYLDERGKPIRKSATIERITSLVIPPAWENVWICPLDNGHLQATGLDARERKQYLYHPKWQEAANLEKFSRLAEFGELLPSVRRKVRERLKGRDLSRDRVLAGIIAILDETAIRVGNEEYVKANNSFGLTTLRNRHVQFENGHAVLKFRGKSGVYQELAVKPKHCVRLLRQCHRLEGPHVFQYMDETGNKMIASAVEVNQYLNDLTGECFTAKDFRTWAASTLVAGLLFQQSDAATVAERKRVIRAVVKQASDLLGNTVATARKYYIHPTLLEAYEIGQFSDVLGRVPRSRVNGVTRDEKLLAQFLRRIRC